MKKYVLKNNKGFTMIEMLLSLSFLLIILASIPLLIKSLYLFKDNAMDHTHFELMMFRKELSDEIKESTIRLDNAHNRIKFINDTRSTEFTLLNEKIIKSINGRGNITLINNVKAFQVDKISQETFKVLIIIRKGDRDIHEEIYI
ncbi:prepilin-type N-terminal cleavage/methylation domain-containing protein [Mammaliicoccus sciuri]|uniref:competence type IV pilus minor pilin ComGF n=2 Tax=Mammaliicoccus sciuri TaxID=1296 RepID=UPI0021D0F471|nr:competence type IV pilus minor pilin ComGF [Mammaliicoccus sciuri]UXU85117.1 prepilin-type N-terminal cleavage/methylation domain-containing protein [Mammaliicoccus sciuri]UXV25172.1 prepilin-type N-terminal cleavage/methylation domain-containing protein [Mammaliicoccus sciuri]UXV27959.1 prepilin-type N-terminal cleavage/methylation domain-containing protein [Mammaliicoccus sciuri]